MEVSFEDNECLLPVHFIEFSALFVMHGVEDGDPDVEQTEAGDDAAGESVERDGGEMRDEQKNMVVAPEVQPGQRDEDNAEIEADDDTDGELKVLQPSRSLPGRLPGASGRLAAWRDGGGRVRRKEVRLRHAMD
jgi:hypothetical protein